MNRYFYGLFLLFCNNGLFGQTKPVNHVHEFRNTGPELYELSLYMYKTYKGL